MPENQIKEIARKYALKNAMDYGSARLGAVLNKVLSEVPKFRENIKEAEKIITEVINEVNAMPKADIEKEVAKYTFIKKEERIGLPELEWVTPGMQVNTRFAPNPSGFMHIGHAKIAVLCDEYSKKYNGRFYLRFDDTDPKTKKPLPEAYAQTAKDLEWLGCKVYQIIKQSERIELYYKFAEELIRNGNAYVCTCAKEEMQENRKRGIACACRSSSKEEALDKWAKMKTVYKEGEAVLRLKTDLAHPNSSIRDWVMFRIIDYAHPVTGTKYRVWPLYNFASAVDDHEMQITLVIRGKEHELNQMKQQYLFDAFSWHMPHVLEVGALKVQGELAHKSDIKIAISEGRLSGWDDPRAPTIMGFRTKGVNPKAIREYIIASGIKKHDSYLDLQKIAAISKKLS